MPSALATSARAAVSERVFRIAHVAKVEAFGGRPGLCRRRFRRAPSLRARAAGRGCGCPSRALELWLLLLGVGVEVRVGEGFIATWRPASSPLARGRGMSGRHERRRVVGRCCRIEMRAARGRSSRIQRPAPGPTPDASDPSRGSEQ